MVQGVLLPGVAWWARLVGDRALDVFVRGTDNRLRHNRSEGGWNGRESLGGVLTGGAGGGLLAPERLDVVVRGSDNALRHKCWDGSGWSNWESLVESLTHIP